RLMSRLGVVFGGSCGIGRAVSQLLALKGHRVAVISRNQEAAQATVDTLSGASKIKLIYFFFAADHMGLACDVTQEQEVQRTFKTITKTCGPVGYLVNAAGIYRNALSMSKPNDTVSVFHTNLLGSMLTCWAGSQSMHTNGGAIVNIGSVVGLNCNADQSLYSISKASLKGFTRSLATEVASRNIRVNMVAPGFIRTDMTAELNEDEHRKRIPLGRFGDPVEAAHAVLFLLESPYITGHVMSVDGGLHL
ncbi:carbonyl reductase family member 4, partial [Silurus meridionalis]